jgi:hypothetical protein
MFEHLLESKFQALAFDLSNASLCGDRGRAVRPMPRTNRYEL